MKTIIIYASSHGCTKKAVDELAELLSGEIITVNIEIESPSDLSDFERVIVGGSIHMGQIQKKIKNFCTSNVGQLKSKEIGLFICCMYEPGIAIEELRDAFPEELHQLAKTEAIFGGEFNFEEMSFVEKILVRKIAHVRESVSQINHDSIERFATRMEKTYHPFLFLV